MAKMTRKELRTLILEQATRGYGEAQPNSPSGFQGVGSEVSRDLLVHLWTEVLNNRQKKELGEFMFEKMRAKGMSDNVIDALRKLYMAALKAERKEKWHEFFRLK